MASRRAPARSSPSVFWKKSSFPRFARKEYFFQKTLRVALFTPSVLHSFFLFFGFSFFGVPVCSLRYALPTTHRTAAAPTAPTEPPHSRTATTPTARHLRAWFPMADRFRQATDEPPPPRHRPQSMKFGRAFRTDGAAIAEPSRETRNVSQCFEKHEKQYPFLVVSQWKSRQPQNGHRLTLKI